MQPIKQVSLLDAMSCVLTCASKRAIRVLCMCRSVGRVMSVSKLLFMTVWVRLFLNEDDHDGHK